MYDAALPRRRCTALPQSVPDAQRLYTRLNKCGNIFLFVMYADSFQTMGPGRKVRLSFPKPLRMLTFMALALPQGRRYISTNTNIY